MPGKRNAIQMTYHKQLRVWYMHASIVHIVHMEGFYVTHGSVALCHQACDFYQTTKINLCCHEEIEKWFHCSRKSPKL